MTVGRDLNGKQIRFLRAKGHHLKPIALAGKDGLSESFLLAVGTSLECHELIKVKLLETCAMDRHEAATELAQRTGSHLVQVLGRSILLYRAGEKRIIELPQ